MMMMMMMMKAKKEAVETIYSGQLDRQASRGLNFGRLLRGGEILRVCSPRAHDV